MNFTMTGEAAGDELGYFSFYDAGDVNGDGYSDIIVGAYAGMMPEELMQAGHIFILAVHRWIIRLML